MEELKKFQGSTFDTSSRRKLVEDRDTILELKGKIQESQNELNCMNDAREFQDVFSTQWFIPRYQSTSVFPTSSRSWWNAKPFSGNAAKMGRQVFGTHMVYRETFLQIQRRLLQHLIRKSLILVAQLCHKNTSPHVMSESQTPVQAFEMPVRTLSQKLSHPLWGRIFKELWSRPTKTADLETSLWQIPYTKNICLLEDKTPNWGMYLLTICTEAMLWIKEVEMVESVDDLKFLRSIKGFSGPDFEVLDARIASALNKNHP